MRPYGNETEPRIAWMLPRPILWHIVRDRGARRHDWPRERGEHRMTLRDERGRARRAGRREIAREIAAEGSDGNA